MFYSLVRLDQMKSGLACRPPPWAKGYYVCCVVHALRALMIVHALRAVMIIHPLHTQIL